MTKKGTFKLSSYLVENQLIFFKSKIDKIIAFAIISTSNFIETLPILTKMLKKNYFEYFSWQIGVNKERKDFFIFNFRDSKAGIVKAFNLFKQELNNCNFKILFLNKERLKSVFFEIISQELDSNILIDKSSKSIIIKNSVETRTLSVFELNLSILLEKENLIESIINYFRDSRKKVILYFNFCTNYLNLISYHGIIIEELNQKREIMTLDEKVNKFFNQILLNRINIKLKQVMLLFWRKSLLSSQKFYEIPRFSLDKNIKNKSSLLINELIVNLNKYQVDYHQINDKILFIENHILFIVINRINLKFLLTILKKYYSKYKIMLLFLTEREYCEFLEIDRVTELKELKLLRMSDLVEFNYKNLKID